MQKFAEIVLLADCNYSCDYCISGSNLFPFQKGFNNFKVINKDRRLLSSLNGSPKMASAPPGTTDEEIAEKWNLGYAFEGNILDYTKLLPLFATDLKGWKLVISGGEPLLYPNIDYWLSKTLETNDVVLLTNASKINRIRELLYKTNLFLRIGYHPEQRDMDEFDAVLWVASHGNYIINYMLHPRHLENGKVDEYISFLEERNLNYEVSPFEGEYKGVHCDARNFYPGTEKYISSHYKVFLDEDPADWVGESMIYVSAAGVITGCARGLTGNGHVEVGYLPNVCSPEKGLCKNDKTGCGCTSVRLYGHGLLQR